MAKNKGRLAKLVIQGNTADFIKTLDYDSGITTEDTTHLQSAVKEYDDMLRDPVLTGTGYVDYTDTAQELIRAAVDTSPATLSGVLAYTNDTKYYTFPDTAIVDSYSESMGPDGFVEFNFSIRPNGAVTLT
jgi:hypothetical protein